MKTYKTHITVSLNIPIRDALEKWRQAEEIKRLKRVTTSSIVEEILVDAFKKEFDTDIQN